MDLTAVLAVWCPLTQRGSAQVVHKSQMTSQGGL